MGIGQKFIDYTQKVEWYSIHIATNNSIANDDIILLIDAYDVIITPAIRRIGEVSS